MKRVTSKFSQTAIAAAVSVFFGLPAAHAAGEVQLENIVVTGDKPATAPYEAPTQGSLDAGEPQSIINQRYIENNLTTAANYTDVINIAPSVVDTTPNGKGNAESLNMSIRGLQDGQFNVTFDGIPWNDSNDFTHHSTSYFTSNSIGRVTVDRGPGTAAQIGNATFGGTVAIESKDPMVEHNLNAALSVGSFRSNDYSVQYDTGTMTAAGNGRAMFTATAINSDGAMTNNGLNRKNVFFKYVQPVSSDTTITGVVMYNTIHQNVSQFGSTLGQLAQFGPNFSLSENPSSETYYGYNFDDIHTDFEYVDVKTNFAGWHVDNKVYTYAYYHGINETNDPSLTTGSLAAYLGITPTGLGATDVAGQKGLNNYRSIGDTARFDREIGPGTVRFGLWADYQWNDRVLWEVDWTQGGIPITQTAPGVSQNGFERNLHETLTTLAPFVEYEFRPTESISVTPGLRYTSFRRSLDALVDQYSLGPNNNSHTWSAAQPSIYVLDHLLPNWSVYAQAARGFLAPNAKVTYSGVSAAQVLSSQSPQTTMNYQVGTTWKTERVTLAADYYRIDFSNLDALKLTGASSLIHSGGAIYKGEEFEGTFAIGAGFSLYGNISHNGSQYKDGTPVYYAPSGTSAISLIFDSGPYFASITSKHVGSTIYNGANTNNATGVGAVTLDGYTVHDLAMAYKLDNPGAGLKDAKIRFTVSNFSNNRAVYFLYNQTPVTGVDTYMTLAGRAYMLGVSADF